MKVHKVRVEQANQRNAERGDRSVKQQLAELDNRLGVKVGATKERNRLAKKVNV